MSRWQISVVDIPSVSDSFHNKDVIVTVPRDDRTVIASTKLEVRIATEFFEAVRSPVFRLVKFRDQSFLGFRVESVQ